jgi:uncharacterized protein DUF4365
MAQAGSRCGSWIVSTPETALRSAGDLADVGCCRALEGDASTVRIGRCRATPHPAEIPDGAARLAELRLRAVRGAVCQRRGRRRAIRAVQGLLEDANHIYQPVLGSNDIGKDAYVDIVEHGEVTGDVIALQIKGGESFRRARGYAIPCTAPDIELWRSSSIPVFGVVHDAGKLHWTNLTAWARALASDARPAAVLADPVGRLTRRQPFTGWGRDTRLRESATSELPARPRLRVGSGTRWQHGARADGVRAAQGSRLPISHFRRAGQACAGRSLSRQTRRHPRRVNGGDARCGESQGRVVYLTIGEFPYLGLSVATKKQICEYRSATLRTIGPCPPSLGAPTYFHLSLTPA